MNLPEQPHVVGSYFTIEGQKNGTVESVMVVQTDLELDATHSAFDKVAVDALLKTVADFHQANSNVIGRIRIEPARPR